MQLCQKKVRGNQNCSVPQCKSVRHRCSHLSFHRFPNDKSQHNVWKIKLRIGKKVGSSASVCSLHFLPSDFFPTTNATSRPHLKKGAVPSQNLPVHPSDKAQPATDKRSRGGPLLTPKSEPPDELAQSVADATWKQQDKKVAVKGDHMYSHPTCSGEPDSAMPPSPLSDEETACGDGDSNLSSTSKRPQSSTSQGPPSVGPPVTVPPPLTLRRGHLARHLAAVKEKQRLIQTLQGTFNSLLYKTEFMNKSPGWTGEIPPPRPDAPLLTLRDDRVERFPPLKPVDPLNPDLLRPLSPSDAWKAVAALLHQLLDMQLKVMYARVQVIAGDLRKQESDGIHARFRTNVTKELHLRQQAQKAYLLANRPRPRYVNCSILSRRARQADQLSKKLEKILTPMQMTVIRTGRKPRWAEEDIRRAIELMIHLGREHYEVVRKRVRIPMPSPKIVPLGVRRFPSLEPLFAELVGSENSIDGKAEKDFVFRAVRKRKLRDESPEMAGSESPSESPPAKRLVPKRKKGALKRIPLRPRSLPSHSPQLSELSQPSQHTRPSQPSQPPQHSRPLQPPQPSRPLQSPQPSRPLQPPQPSRPLQPPQSSRPLQPPQPSRPRRLTRIPQPSQPPRPSQPSHYPKPARGASKVVTITSQRSPSDVARVTSREGGARTVVVGMRRPCWNSEGRPMGGGVSEMTRPPDVTS